ncbi:MAG: hypothetical protein ABW003_15340 [Microvirga sp.]
MTLFRGSESAPQTATGDLPRKLAETGLYSDVEALKVDAAHLAFSPQYPLWSDGAAKRRWISLPAGGAIEGSKPEAWAFPVGTRFWKEFSFGDRRIETRYMERKADGQWLYAAYAWSADGREAHLAPERGKRGAYDLGGGRSHTIPGTNDCKACHQGGRAEVLGFSAFQLSSERDPFAVHAEPMPAPGVDLRYLVEKGLLVGLANSSQPPPRVASSSETERSVLGYLHANCGHCHNEQGSLKNLELFLSYEPAASVQPAISSTFARTIKKTAPGQSPDAVLRIEPGRADRSGLMQRIASRYAALQMPPLGTELVDGEAVALIQRWIAEANELRK